MSEEVERLPERQDQLEEGPKDFFISYTSKDSQWAEWIAFELERAGYTTVIQKWDSRPGMNFVWMMNDATKRTERTIVVLSAAYLESGFGLAEWAAAFRHDPTGRQKRLVPVRIEVCEVQGLLGPIVYLDLVDLDETQAKEQLLAGVKQERAKPQQVGFPGSALPHQTGPVVREHPVFPGIKTTIVENTGPVQGQVVGDHTTVYNYFYDPIKSSVSTSVVPPQRVWNIPYPRNPFFTGRTELLTKLAATLHIGQPTVLSQPQAISGLGGIGKTQIAIEYAYQHEQDYQAVLWAQADTRENLTSSFLALAGLLNLPEREASESAHVIAAVKQWLQTTPGYLLILDNADDLALARDFLPAKRSGQVLLTTRAQATGRFAHRLEVDALPTKQGVLFLLHRAGLLAHDATIEQAKEADRTIAKRLCEDLGGLPLALDQAGAYIEETGCSLAKYQRHYQQQRGKVLAERRGELVNDHPLPVAATWKLSFEQVEQRSQAGADLLRVCAFLAPDAIPEWMIVEGAEKLGPILGRIAEDEDVLEEAVEALKSYSFIKRDTVHEMLSVHRLVQAVVKDGMSEEEQRRWAEQVVLAVNVAFPDVQYDMWKPCEQILTHALACAQWIEQKNLLLPEGASLLNRAGLYLEGKAQYEKAEALYQRALVIREHVLGSTHSHTGNILNNLAVLYQEQKRESEAEPLLLRALAIYEQQPEDAHLEIWNTLNNLAVFYQEQKRESEAEPLLLRALAIYEQQPEDAHLKIWNTLNNLALLYQDQEEYGKAEQLLKQALAISERELGNVHPDMVDILNNLAILYLKQGRYNEANPLLQRALAISQQQLGIEHPKTQSVQKNYAILLALVEQDESTR